MVFTAPMSCRSHSINNINIIRIFTWEIGYCMQLVIERAKGALCSSGFKMARLLEPDLTGHGFGCPQDRDKP